MKKKHVTLLSALLLLALLLAACGTKQTPEGSFVEPSLAPAAEQAKSEADYSSVTSLSKEDVEAFAQKAKDAYLAEDWETLSGMIGYPIVFYPDIECADAASFVAYMQGKHVTKSDAAVMEDEPCTDLVFTGQGIRLGTGQLWLTDRAYMTEGEPDLVIFSVYGFE